MHVNPEKCSGQFIHAVQCVHVNMCTVSIPSTRQLSALGRWWVSSPSVCGVARLLVCMSVASENKAPYNTIKTAKPDQQYRHNSLYIFGTCRIFFVT